MQYLVGTHGHQLYPHLPYHFSLIDQLIKISRKTDFFVIIYLL